MAFLKLVAGSDMDARRNSERAFNQKVGQRLKEWRLAKGMSLEWVAGRLDIDATNVLRHESGATPLTCVRAARMCQILGHTLLELFA